jgi:hypothetical protein
MRTIVWWLMDHVASLFDAVRSPWGCQMLNDWPTRRLWWWAIGLEKP